MDRLTRFKTLPTSILGSTPIDSSLSASRWRCDGLLLLEADDEAFVDSVPDADRDTDVLADVPNPSSVSRCPA